MVVISDVARVVVAAIVIAAAVDDDDKVGTEWEQFTCCSCILLSASIYTHNILL